MCVVVPWVVVCSRAVVRGVVLCWAMVCAAVVYGAEHIRLTTKDKIQLCISLRAKQTKDQMQEESNSVSTTPGGKHPFQIKEKRYS